MDSLTIVYKCMLSLSYVMLLLLVNCYLIVKILTMLATMHNILIFPVLFIFKVVQFHD